MKITLAMLEHAGACREQRDLFASLFPDGAELTVDLAVQHSIDFDWEWACCLLSARGRAAYDKDRALATARYIDARAGIEAEYGKAAEAAYAEYIDARVVIEAEHGKAVEAAHKHKKAVSAARFDRDKAANQAITEFERAQATAWSTAALTHGLDGALR